MKCPGCGKEIGDGLLFCEHCGEEIRIVKDFKPGVDDLIAGSGVTVFDRMKTENRETREEKEKEEPAEETGRRSPGRKRTSFHFPRWPAYACGLLLLFILGCILLGIESQNAAYQNEKAQEYIEKRNYEKAVPYAERAVELEPDNAEYLLSLLECLDEEGDEERRISLALQIIDLDGSCQAAYKILISIYEENQEYVKINELLQACTDEQITSQYPGYLARPPEFSVKSGIYNETLSLKLLASTKGTVYYTTDGSRPDEGSQVYASPIFLESGNYRIRAVFVNDYGVMSDVAEESFYVDVTAPEAPVVSPEGGEYTRPTLITVEAGEDCTVYYTTDGSAPTRDSTEYTGPFSMPVGNTVFRFISYSLAGVAGEETRISCSLNLHATLSIEAARNMLLLDLMEAGVIRNLNGGVRTGTGHNVYNYRYVVTIDDTDYYLYREYYEDDDGNRAGTGSDYVVSVMDGQCYKVVQAAPETRGRVSEDSSENPWSGLTLQNINSDFMSEP